MLKEILLETIGIKRVEQGELITPIDEFTSKEVFEDKELEKRIGKETFYKGDTFEIQIVTPQEIVCYIPEKEIYVLLDKRDLTEFEYLS